MIPWAALLLMGQAIPPPPPGFVIDPANPFADLVPPPPAERQAAHKLIVAWAQGGVIALDYPNWDRCQRARAVVEREAARRIQNARRTAPPGGVLVGAPWTAYAFCIPA